jgi:hypothetical protein
MTQTDTSTVAYDLRSDAGVPGRPLSRLAAAHAAAAKIRQTPHADRIRAS